MDGFDFTYWAVVDEKYFSEDKHKNEEIEARISSPLEPESLYYVMAAETLAQLKKKMFLVALSEGIAIGCFEIDCTDTRNKTKKG